MAQARVCSCGQGIRGFLVCKSTPVEVLHSVLERLVCSADEGVESQAGDGEQKRRRRALGHRAMEIIGATVSARTHHGAKGGQAPCFPNDTNGNCRGKVLEEGRGPI